MQFKITNGSVSFGADTILECIDFEIKDKEKIAVVGRNGCGKTTLLKAITGEVPLEEGTGEQTFNLAKAGNPVVGYLKQIAFKNDSVSMLDEILTVFEPIFKVEEKMAELLDKLQTSSDEKTVKAYSEACDRYEFMGGYTYKKEYSAMIKSFGFTEEDKAKPLAEFSGGQRTKIAFIKLLLSKPDILLLDEPTNHLDVTTVKWLEEYLKNYKSAVVIVSHDRMFLNRIVSKVYEIEYGETKCYTGNYADFERQKRINYDKQLKDHEIQRNEIARLQRLIERFRYKATKAKMVQSKIKLIERMKIIDAPNRYDLKTFHANFQPLEESVKQVLVCKNLKIGYDFPLAEIDLELLRGQKLGVIGGNGIGKSTFLKTLMGLVPSLGGNYSFGVKTKIGYFDQKMAEITGEESVMDNFHDVFPRLTELEVRSSLGAFGFSGEEVFKSINVLSGGERVRLELCKIFKRRPNVLILDEPTNHMDIVGKETLENMLKEYQGTVVFVSHDRYFVNKIADRILAFEEGKVTFFEGGYTEYEEYEKTLAPDTQEKPTGAEIQPQKKTFSTPLKDKTKKQKRVQKLEQLIDDCSEKIKKINESLSLPEVYSDYKKVAELQEEADKLAVCSEEYTEEWTALSLELENFD